MLVIQKLFFVLYHVPILISLFYKVRLIFHPHVFHFVIIIEIELAVDFRACAFTRIKIAKINVDSVFFTLLLFGDSIY
jgi:hypothetical protein